MSKNPIHQCACTNCNYTAQVVHERYFESSCQQEISTRKCNHCHRLSIAAVTKKARFTKHPSKEEFQVIYNANRDKYLNDFESSYAFYIPLTVCEELKQVKCLWCGSTRTEEWNIKQPDCPKCGSRMQESTKEALNIKAIKDYESFDDMIQSAKKVIVCLMSDLCLPCEIIQPVIIEINDEFPNKFLFVKLDADYAEKNDLIYKYKIKYFPTFLLFENGKYKGKFSNVNSKPEMLKKMRKKQRKLITTMDFDKEINLMLDKLYKLDAYLLQQKLDINERALTHRMGIYLQELFPNLHVDCEYNRMGKKTSMGIDYTEGDYFAKTVCLSEGSVSDEDDSGSRVFPDIIIHNRDTADNFAIIEVKVQWKNERASQDYKKLNAYIKDLGYYCGYYIELAENRKDVKIEKLFKK